MDSYTPPNQPLQLENPWYIMRNWAHWVGFPMRSWDLGPERAPDQPDIPSLVGAGLESFADAEFASDFLEECWHMDTGPDEYRRLSAKWKDRSKADEFVAIAVEQYESDNRSPSPIGSESGEEASPLDWILAF